MTLESLFTIRRAWIRLATAQCRERSVLCYTVYMPIQKPECIRYSFFNSFNYSVLWQDSNKKRHTKFMTAFVTLWGNATWWGKSLHGWLQVVSTGSVDLKGHDLSSADRSLPTGLISGSHWRGQIFRKINLEDTYYHPTCKYRAKIHPHWDRQMWPALLHSICNRSNNGFIVARCRHCRNVKKAVNHRQAGNR